MASIPYSILFSQKRNILPISTIQEHQKFCRKFIKAHQSFEKYKNNSQSKLAFYNDTVYLLNQKQSQLDVIAWLNTLPEEKKLTLFSIKNKWLTNIFMQLFFIHYKIGNYNYKPLKEMNIFFDDQKKYLSKDESNIYYNSLFEILESRNIPYKSGLIEDNSNNNDNEETDFSFDELNLYTSFFESKEIADNNNNHKNNEKKKFENKLMENIRVISSEKDNFDTITFNKNFIMNNDNVKKFLEHFSNNNYFKDWIIPIRFKNVYNFVLPYWMHNIQELSLCQLIMGFFEQKILVNYEYYYYTKQYHEYSFDKQISELYNENIKLEKYILKNYSFNKNNKNKEEILTQEKITKVVDELRSNLKFNKKITAIKDIFNKICMQKSCYIGKEISFNDELSKEIYNYLIKEILKEKKSNYVSKMIDLITFIPFIDIINLKENIFYNFRKNILDSQNDSILDELLQSEEIPHKKNNNKKHKKKKKKNETEILNNNSDDNKSKNVNKPNSGHIKINIYDVQTKEIECEYNMNSRNTQFNMIPETASNILINSYNNNNNIFIRGNKKSEEKKPVKIVTPKKEEEKPEKKEEKKDEKKEDKKENKKEEIKEEKKEEDLKEDIKEDIKEKIKEKNKNKDFFLFPINKEKKNENNINCINVIKNTKEKNKKRKNKKHKNSKKEEEKDKIIKNKNIFNYVQERKNNVQINPCPRRKKNVLFQTSRINFEMHNQFPFDYYPYYYSFPLMKPFTSLSEVSTKFSMPSTIKNNNKQPQNNNTNNININNTTNNKKSHWDYNQYNKNYNNALQIFNSFIPSEKYFESLNKELNNYLLVTNSNNTNLKNLYINKLEIIENLLQNGLSENYDIKFGHYGSFFTNLSIEGSDLDILVYYHKKKEENDFYKDILNILQQKEGELLEDICPILSATVPVIKLKIDIRKEIKDKDIKLKNTTYFEEEDLTKIKIDLTFTENEQEFQNSGVVISYINKSLSEYPQIKPILLLLKRYFKQMNMNKNYTGGLCSYSLFLLVLSFCKCNKQCESSTKLLYYFMENFTYFDYCNYYIDVEKENCYILKEKNDNTEKSVSDENSSYDTNYELYEKEEIVIVDPITKINVSKSSFKVDEIILTFRKAFNLLYYEGWYYDYCSKNKNNENNIIENVNELYEDDSSDYMIIKKLFGLKTLRNNFDFYFN